MDTCPNCGNDRRPGARFCRQCGYSFADDPDDPPTKSPIEPIGDEPETPTGQPSETDLPLSMKPTLPARGSEADEPDRPGIDLPSTDTDPLAAYDSLVDIAEPTALSSVAAYADPKSPAADSPPTPNPVRLGEGRLIAGRFRIIRSLSVDEGGPNLYEAEDRLTCPNCKVIQPDPNERFCLMCGAEMTARPIVKLREAEASSPPEAESRPAGEAGQFQDHGLWYQIVTGDAADAAGPPTVGMQLSAAYQTHPGMVRDIDEDSILAMQLSVVCEARSAPALGFFAVADGIGGSDAGEVASRAAVRSLAEGVLRRVFAPLAGGDSLLPENLDSHLRDAIHEANRAILAIRQERNLDLGCTLTAALICGEQAIIANVGDSRTYLMRGGKLAPVTQDHSLVASLIAAGLSKPEEIYTHEKKSVIYRSLGDKPELEIDTFPLTLQPGDRLLLCCDGLWEMVRDNLIEDTLLQYPDNARYACATLIKLANSAGGEDNISVIIVDALPQPELFR